MYKDGNMFEYLENVNDEIIFEKEYILLTN